MAAPVPQAPMTRNLGVCASATGPRRCPTVPREEGANPPVAEREAVERSGLRRSWLRRGASTPSLLSAFVFALVAIAELWSPIAHGMYPLPGDIGQQWPLTHVGTQPPVPRNSLLSDVYVDFGPFLHFDVSNITHGRLPLWNPYNGNGQPYLADDQTVVLSPFGSGAKY